jgi:hypothetical protein
MELISFDFDTRLAQEFLDCGHARNAADPNFILPLRPMLERQLQPDYPYYNIPGNAHRHFLMRDGGRAVGRVSAFVNCDLRDGDGTAVGTVGFYECVDDDAVAEALLTAATDWLRSCGLRRAWGPMNFDIWHSYRFITRGAEGAPFVSEPRNAPWYPAQFERAGFRAAHHWESVLFRGEERLQGLMEYTRPIYERLTARGFSFRDADTRAPEQDFRLLYRLLLPAFRDFPGYTSITEEDFVALLQRNRDALAPGLFSFFTRQEYGDVGFTAAFLDRASAVQALRGEWNTAAKLRYMLRRRASRRVIYLLGGVLPQHARAAAGCARASVYLTLQRAVAMGMDEVLVALMRRGNRVRGLFNVEDADEIREYALYEMTL